MANIQDIWISHEEIIWKERIGAYWEYVEGQGKKALEAEMDDLDSAIVRNYTYHAWRDFLANKVIPWKHSPGRFWRSIQAKFAAHYATHEQHALLTRIKHSIFACDPERTRELLELVDGIYQFGIPSAWACSRSSSPLTSEPWIGSPSNLFSASKNSRTT